MCVQLTEDRVVLLTERCKKKCLSRRGWSRPMAQKRAEAAEGLIWPAEAWNSFTERLKNPVW